MRILRAFESADLVTGFSAAPISFVAAKYAAPTAIALVGSIPQFMGMPKSSSMRLRTNGV